ncbi:MAG: type III toxin-antitoxin system ToxN/AbiQ family toxin [Lachnospiraceae bacterium]|nr:type III toxin-antitoxin system ToxN/AbiQ family toxin [Lachnospiraceae bacterium]
MLKIYNIDNKYIDFLKQFESNIDYNVKENDKHKRPYIGIVLEMKQCLYFAPLKSPKRKFDITMKSHTDIVLIDDGEKGIINLNDMIPITKENFDKLLTEVEYKINDADDIDDIKYKNLIQDQINWCNKKENKEIIYKKAKRIYNLYDKLPSNNKLKQRCCNFKYLEKKMKEYK